MSEPLNKVLASLKDYWDSLLEALPRVGVAIIIVASGILLANGLDRFFSRRVAHRVRDPLIANFIARVLKTLVIVVFILLALDIAGLSGMAGALFATAGASAIVLGFAFKDIVENFLAGIILAFNRPFMVNDTLEIGGIFGRVKAMQFRYTHIKTFDGKDVYIPNADILKKPVINYTADGYIRTDFIVGIAYENDIELAKELIMECINDCKDVIKDAEHINFVAEEALAPSTVNLKVFFWVNTIDYRKGTLEVKGRLIQDVKKKLEANGFSLPADIMEIKFYNSSSPFHFVQDKGDAGTATPKQI